MNSGTENDSVKDEKAKERTKKFEDMGGFEKIIREAWEGQKRTKKISGNIALTVMVLSLLAIGNLLMLVPFLEFLGNPYSLPISTGSSIDPWIHFPFYDIYLPYQIGFPSTYLSVYLILPMQFLIVQSMSPILQMQIVFYLLLGLLLIVLSAGLIKLKNWGRKGTIIYCTVSLGYSFITLFPIFVTWLNLALFNVNILVALTPFTIFASIDSLYYLLAILANILHIILAVSIIVYLSGDVKYEFEQEKHEIPRVDVRIMGDDRAVEPLIQALKHEDWKIRVSAATALGEMGDERALKPLFQTLNDESNLVRRFAELALAKIIKNKME